AAVGAARRVVVVGPVEVPDGVLRTREDPPFGGPVAAVDAGFAILPDHAAWTLLLACDLPGAEAGVRQLLRSQPGPDHDGVCLVDDDHRRQWLLGRYRSEALARRLADRGDPPLTAMHRLLGPLNLLGIPAAGWAAVDVDTPADAVRWAAELETGR
ncbi:MAG: NTP transferase domain-containing protein, partial [Propionicimonas sp.]